MSTTSVQRQSTITCPSCGHRRTETMPVNACVFFYECAACSTVLRPRPGDCCVFCSFGSTPCPPKQDGKCDGDCCGPASTDL